MALVEAKGLTKVYPARGAGGVGARVVDDVSFEIERGETLGLVGESGSGKSTVARMLLRLVESSAGTVGFDGVSVTAASTAEMRRLRRRMQIVFQDPFAALNPRMRVEEIVAEPLVIHRDEDGVYRDRAGRLRRVREMLGVVGMDESALGRYPHEFSGGQRQRINLARALILRPELLVLDEPVSALDVSVGAQIINLLRDLQQEFKLTCLFISHSMPLVRYLSTRIAVMHRGRLVEIGPALEICDAPREEYTRGLLDASRALELQD